MSKEYTLKDVTAQMKYHGYKFINGRFYKPLTNWETPKSYLQAIEWLKSLNQCHDCKAPATPHTIGAGYWEYTMDLCVACADKRQQEYDRSINLQYEKNLYC